MKGARLQNWYLAYDFTISINVRISIRNDAQVHNVDNAGAEDFAQVVDNEIRTVGAQGFWIKIYFNLPL